MRIGAQDLKEASHDNPADQDDQGCFNHCKSTLHNRIIPMDHVAEVTLPDCVAIYRFNDEKEGDCEQMAELLGELADEGLIYRLEFYTSQ